VRCLPRRQFSSTPIMTNKWDIQGRSIDLTGKKRLVVVDFDNTCTFLESWWIWLRVVFQTPLPNTTLWQKDAYSAIMSDRTFVNGGW